MLSTTYIIILLFSFPAFILGSTFDRMCSRIYFEHPDEQHFPFVNILDAVYIKTDVLKDNVPVYKNERGSVSFLYSRSKNIFYFNNDEDKNDIELKATAKRWLIDAVDLWMTKVDKNHPFGSAISQFFYKRNGQRYNLKNITPRCVEFVDCGSNDLIFTLKFSLNDGKHMVYNNDPQFHYFKQLDNVFRYNRPVYRHSNKNTEYYLFYKSGYWKIGKHYDSDSAVLGVKSTAFKPYFIVNKWKKYKYLGIYQDEIDGTIQCHGQYSKTFSCSQGLIKSNIIGDYFCVCTYHYTGKACSKRAKMCNKYNVDSPTTVNFQIGAVSTQFCQKNSQKVLKQVLCKRSHSISSLRWITEEQCDDQKTTETTKITEASKPKSTPRPFNLDENESDSLKIKVLVIAIPIILALVHCCCYSSFKGVDLQTSMRIWSSHAYIGFYCWLIFLAIFFACDLKIYGPSTMNFVYITALVFVFFNYVFVLFEACISSENEYLSEPLENEDAGTFIDSVCAAKPTITFSMECYHIEIKTREVAYIDAQGEQRYRTETYTEKIKTWAGKREFNYSYWKDDSDRTNFPVYSANTVVKIKMKKSIKFANAATKTALIQQEQDFINSNKHRDEKYTIDTEYTIPEFKERIMCYHRNYGLPCWINSGCFWLASIMCCTWPFRIMLSRSSRKQNFEVVKLVSMTPFPTDDQGQINQPANETTLLQPSAPLLEDLGDEEEQPPPSYDDVMAGRYIEMQDIYAH